MAVKYECPECGRRFLEWGAEKVGFKCPNDDSCPDGHPEDVELNPIVFEQDQPIRRKPTLKRTPTTKRKAAAKKTVQTEDDVLEDADSNGADDVTDTIIDGDDASGDSDEELPVPAED